MVLGVAVVLLLAYAGYQAVLVRRQLAAVASDYGSIESHLRSGDSAAARSALADAQQHANRAHELSDGWVWGVSAHLPGVGPDVTAVRTVARVSDTVSGSVLPDVLRAAEQLSPADLRPTNGRVDLALIRRAQPVLARVDRGLQQQSRAVSALDASELFGPLRQPVTSLQGRLDGAAATADQLSRAARLLPPMLGAGGERRYLLMFQNNAELRSTGGIPGSFAVLTARNGRLSMSSQGNSGSMGTFTSHPVPLTAEEKAVFGSTPGRFPQDVTAIPDFPRAAQLAVAMWHRQHHQPIDGVLSADPVAVSLLLRGTGPVAVPGGQLTSQDAVSKLLSAAYARLPDPLAQDRYFSAVAGDIFQAVVRGQGNPRAVLGGLSEAATQRRLLVWSAHPAEQQLLASTRIAGELTVAGNDKPQVGVFLNDNGASKLDYYLRYKVDVQPRNCTDGRQRMFVTLRLHSTVPRKTASLPAYVVNHDPDLPRGRIALTVLSYAPEKGSIVREEVDGHARDVALFQHAGRTVALDQLTVDPGGSRTVRWFVLSGRGQGGAVRLHVTPGAHSDGVGAVGPPQC